MATPNYGYEKRQRELAKRQKKEEKLRAKAEAKRLGIAVRPEDDDASDLVGDEAAQPSPGAPDQPDRAP